MSVDETTVPPSISVVEAVASAEGVDPLSLEPPLHQVVDPDALDALFTEKGPMVTRRSRVHFRYRGFAVTVEKKGDVSLEKLSPDEE